MDLNEFVKAFGPSILGFLTLIPAFFLLKANLKKILQDIDTARASQRTADATASEIYQRSFAREVEDSLQKSQTLADLRGTIEAQHGEIEKLSIALASEQTARKQLEATIVALNTELAEERKARLTALTELGNLKAWTEELVRLLRNARITIPPYPTV